MDHREFLRSLSRADRKALSEQSDGPGLRHLAVYVSLILLLAVPIALRVPGWPFLMVPLGILLAFLFNLEHECTHTTAFRTSWINEWSGRISGFLILQPFQWFRHFHFAHHRFTNDPERDPELTGKPKPETVAQYIVFASGPLYWKNKIILLFRNARGRDFDDFVPQKARRQLRTEARVSLAIYAAVLAFSIGVSPAPIWVWLVPLVIGFPILRLYHLAEHGLCPPVADMFENSRTVLTNPVVRFVTWNMPYHIEHHTLPMVPFFRLPDLHRLVREHLGQTSNGYARFSLDYARRLTLARRETPMTKVDR